MNFVRSILQFDVKAGGKAGHHEIPNRLSLDTQQLTSRDARNVKRD